MAVKVASTILLFGAIVSPATLLVAADYIAWAGDLQNLDFAELGVTEQQQLKVGYAQDIAQTLGLSVDDVFDMHGHPGQISLGPMVSETSRTRGSITPGADTSTRTATTSMTNTSTRTTSTTSTTTSTTSTSTLPSLRPLRGIAYGALPCTAFGCGGHGRPAEDMLQVGYEEQWGSKGRDDLGIMARLGSNAVRLYHSLGLKVKRDHGGFLDYAKNLGLNVMPGYHTEAANINGECPNFDCFETWKAATLAGFEHGFKKDDSYHPAVATLILLNEPDFFQTAPKCQPPGAWCRVKAAISALDGVLAAEKEAGVSAGRVTFTITWSFAMRESIDGKVRGPGIYGFQDMVAVIQDPQIVQYTPRSSHVELQDAFRARWLHGLNTQSPWSFVRDIISKDYSQFLPTPWFIGEYGANGQEEATIQADLESMQEHASGGDAFLGAAFFQFQTTFWKGGAEMNFGLFGLGEEQIGQTGEVCEMGCRTWPVHCLTTDLSWLPGSAAHRARAMATAWGGSIDSGSLCSPRRRLEADMVGTTLACQIQVGAVTEGAYQIVDALNTVSFGRQIVARTVALLGNESDALQGELSLASGAAQSKIDHPDGKIPQRSSWARVAAAAVLLLTAGSVAVLCLVQKRKTQGRLEGSAIPGQAV